MTPYEELKMRIRDAGEHWSTIPVHDLGLDGAQVNRAVQEVTAERKAAKVPPQPVNRAGVLDAAKSAVADRGVCYGKPEDNFVRIARLWRAHLMNRYSGKGTASIDAADVAAMMVLLKIARLQNDPTHLDSWIDIAGYAACGAEISA